MDASGIAIRMPVTPNRPPPMIMNMRMTTDIPAGTIVFSARIQCFTLAVNTVAVPSYPIAARISPLSQ